jgi:hypothetical protein
VHQEIVSWHRGSGSHESSLKAIEDLAKQLREAAERQVTRVLQQAPVEGMNFDSFHVTLKTATRFIHFGGTVIDLLGGHLEAARDQITTRYDQSFHGGSINAARESTVSDGWQIARIQPEFERSIVSLSVRLRRQSDASVGKGMATQKLESAYAIDLSNVPNSNAPPPTFPAATVPPGINGRLCALDHFQLFKAPPLSFI